MPLTFVCHVPIVVGFLLIAFMALDGGTQALGLRASNNAVRFGTGIGCAIGSVNVAFAAARFLWNT